MPIFYNWTVDRSGAGIRIKGVYLGLDRVVVLDHKVTADRLAFTANGHRLVAYRGDLPLAVLSHEDFRTLGR